MESEKEKYCVNQQAPITKSQEVSDEHQLNGNIHGIADVVVQTRYNQFLGRINRCRRAPAFNKKIPEAPKNHQPTDQPERRSEIDENAGIDVWSIQQKGKGNIPNEQPWHEDQKEKGFKRGHIIYFQL